MLLFHQTFNLHGYKSDKKNRIFIHSLEYLPELYDFRDNDIDYMITRMCVGEIIISLEFEESDEYYQVLEHKNINYVSNIIRQMTPIDKNLKLSGRAFFCVE